MQSQNVNTADTGRTIAQALGMLERRFEALTANLANTATPGYKRVVAAENSFATELGRARGHLALGAHVGRDMTEGELVQTGSPMDLSLQGAGFFAVDRGGETLYTRFVQVHVDDDGYLVDQRGLRLMGRGGPILSQGNAADLAIDEQGNIEADGQPLDRFAVTEIAGGAQLEDAGPGLYAVGRDAEIQQAEETKVRRGYRESSNVQPLLEMVQMISLQRQFQATQRILGVEADLRSRLAQNFR